MRTYFRLALFVLVFFTLGVQPPSANAQTPPKVRLSFGKAFHNRVEPFTAHIDLTNESSQTIRISRVTLSIMGALSPEELPLRAFETKRRNIIYQTWYKSIAPGATRISFNRDIKVLDLPEGVYPAQTSVFLSNGASATDTSYLVIIDPKEKPLRLAVVWNLHQPEHRLPNGVFINDELADLIANEPGGQGLLSRQLSMADEHPMLKTNLAVSPILLEQLSAMSEGYAWGQVQGRLEEPQGSGAINRVSPEDIQAVSAKRWLASLSTMEKSGRISLLTSPYGQAPLPALASLGWEKDGLEGLALAGAVSRKTLGLSAKPKGLYLPGLLIDSKSASWLVESGFKYGVAGIETSAAAGAGRAPGKAVEVRSGADKSVIFPSDKELTDWLPTVSPEKASQELTALLAHRRLSGPQEKIVTMAPDKPHWLPREELLRSIYGTLAQTPWLTTIDLPSALSAPREPANLKSNSKTPLIDGRYRAELIRSRRDLMDFSSGVSAKNDLGQLLKRRLYVAESIDYLFGSAGSAPPVGSTYLANITKTIDAELAKLELAPPPKITFSTQYGKIPIAVVNRTGYPIRARLLLRGKDFAFSDDNKDVIVLMPKENLVSYNIKAGFFGLSKLRATIYVGKRQIAGRDIEVTVSSLLRYLVVSATTLLLMGSGAIVFIKSRKKHEL